MGRRLLRVFVSLLIIHAMVIPAHAARPQNDGFRPVQPTVDPDADGNKKGDDEDVMDDDDPPIILPAPGTRSPRRPRIRPDSSGRGFRVEVPTMAIAEVSEEFACPLFEVKSYETIVESLEKLNEAVKSSVQCPQGQNLATVVENSKKVKEAVDSLRPLFEKPEDAYGKMQELEEGIAKAVQGADGIVQSLTNKNFVKSACGENLYRSGGMANALSNLVMSLGPFAMLGMSLAPGLSTIVKTSALAIIAGASTYSEYQKVVYGRSLDMNNPEHWKAVVQNTCAYSRVAKKLNYINRYNSGLIPPVTKGQQRVELPPEVEETVIAYNRIYANRTDRLGKYINIAKEDKKRFSQMHEILRMGKIELSQYQAQINEAKNNPEITCGVGLELASLAKNNTGFPNSTIESIEILQEYDPNKNIKMHTSLVKTYERIVQGLQKTTEANLKKDSDVKDCATKALSLVEVIRRIITTYESSLSKVEADRESILMKDPSYRKWKEEYNSVETQKRLGKQLHSLVTNMANASSILHSHLDQRQKSLKYYLFGPQGWHGGKPPVYAWLDHTLGLHKGAIDEFQKTMGHIQTDLYNLKARKINLDYKKHQIELNAKLRTSLVASRNFEGLDAGSFDMKDPLQAREHQLVCQRLISAWDVWTASVYHIESVGLFCDMVDPMISDVTTDKRIVSFCRGSGADVKFSAPAQISAVGQSLKTLTTPSDGYGKRSVEQLALMIPEKIKAMKCNVAGAN